jgi:hypothetical protein
MNFMEALQSRRSIYALGSQKLISDEALEEMLKQILQATPSSYNSQSQRMVLLLGEKSHMLWKIVLEALRKIVSEKAFPKTQAKIKAFDAGIGTILFFDEQKITQGLMEEMPLYKDQFATWYQQHAGMLQSNVWVGLASVGYGASLQHYNELIEAEVQKEFGFPQSWKLLAQMPFGNVLKKAEAKEMDPIAERFRVLK